MARKLKPITPEQIKDIRTLTRRANRRIERATPGQRRMLEKYINRYTGVKAGKFSSSYKGLTYAQAQKKLEDLKRFLAAESSTRKGWDKIKREQIRKANEKLKQMDYDLTDEELTDVLEQLEEGNRSDFYRAVNLVSAAKDNKGGTLSEEEIEEALNQKRSAQEALKEAIDARKRKKIEAFRRVRERGRKIEKERKKAERERRKAEKTTK